MNANAYFWILHHLMGKHLDLRPLSPLFIHPSIFCTGLLYPHMGRRVYYCSVKSKSWSLSSWRTPVNAVMEIWADRRPLRIFNAGLVTVQGHTQVYTHTHKCTHTHKPGSLQSFRASLLGQNIQHRDPLCNTKHNDVQKKSFVRASRFPLQ